MAETTISRVRGAKVLSGYSTHYFYDQNLVEVRLTVSHRESAPGLFHPLSMAKLAREFAEQEEETYNRTPNAFGPWEG
jgi:hypothetical protein